jgi:hypothetical protein
MTTPQRYGPQYGPDITFLGVPRCTWSDPATYAGADVVILGAPLTAGRPTGPAPGSGRSTSGRPATCRRTGRGRRWRCASTGCVAT